MHKSAKMDEPSDSTSVSHDQKEKGSLEKATNEKLNVYIWDMDETIILLKSLLNGTYAMAFNGSKDVQKGIEIGKRWETRILQACDEFFFYEQVSCCHTCLPLVLCSLHCASVISSELLSTVIVFLACDISYSFSLYLKKKLYSYHLVYVLTGDV